ncbi:MAG: helix-turn-helix domain-containing protein [Bacteroidales bacterium]|nr:helix-turn-helix domain-containing protein [Bacteroidales bacterium]MDD2425380.1 helix-turn-helix domain-containing protein [Bacteroidales bacterium]MDD3988797.1 helix-turn-helix domain-containing protein [Bacteroidales bacterium]
MNPLTIFTEVQSRIELLNAVFYFIASTYLFYILAFRKSSDETEKKLVQAVLSGYLLTAGLFLLRVLEICFRRDELFTGNIYSVMLLVTIQLLPVNFYCCNRLNAGRCSFRSYIMVLIILALTYLAADLLVYIYPAVVLHNSTLLLISSILIFFIFNGSFSVKFLCRMAYLRVNQREKIALFENEIFLFSISQLFALLIAIVLISGSEFLYFNFFISVITLINVALLLKIAFMFRHVPVSPDSHSDYSLKDPVTGCYNRSGDNPGNFRAEELYERLIIYFDQKKPYLNPNLKIREVALYLYTNKTYLSRVINEKKRQNFSQFTNYYRIEEVQRLFRENSNLTIQELSAMSGFGSMATFSIAFRYFMGATPADWCKEQRYRNKH